jgi:hypothetical protein
MAVMGRPEKILDQRMFEEMCHIHCTKEEILAILDMDEDTLNKKIKQTYGENVNFSAVYKRFASGGKMSLRRWQWANAEKGNATLQIWLGKQELNQREIVENHNHDRVIIVNDLESHDQHN